MSEFSVLMPLYSGDIPDAFNEALESVLIAQTIRPAEVIIVVDGSISENLNNVLKCWSDKFEVIRRIDLPENIGLSNAMNIGLAECNYNIVFRMDSDDICKEDRFAKQLQFMQLNPKVTMCSGWVKQYDARMKEFVGERLVPTGDNVNSFAMRRTPINHMALCFRRDEVIQAGGYPDTRLPFEDWWLSLRVITAGGIISNLPEYLVDVRTGDAFYERRRGYSYVKKEVSAMLLMAKEGVLPCFMVALNLVIRVPVRLLPRRVMTFIYRGLIN